MSAKTLSSNGVFVYYDQLDDGTIRVRSLKNDSEKRVTLYVDGKETITVNANSSANCDRVATKNVRYSTSVSSHQLWSFTPPKKADPIEPVETDMKSPTQKSDNKSQKSERPAVPKHEKQSVSNSETGNSPEITTNEIQKLIDKNDLFNQDNIKSYINQNKDYIESLTRAKNPEALIDDYGLVEYLSKSKEQIEAQRAKIPEIAIQILSQTNLSSATQQRMMDNVVALLTSRLNEREDSFNELEQIVSKTTDRHVSNDGFSEGDAVNYAIIICIILILAIWLIIAMRKKKKNNRAKSQQQEKKSAVTSEEAHNAIVVRRRTTSILKKQSLEDVIDNPSYFKIETSEFTANSAVRRIYIKNTCIKDVYNLYAEDLRNTENPKEDGCMVLGRWVHNEDSNTYDVSLETVVLPGDDAVFKEYELNFGGKIKLRIAEKLRKLRRDTNLQYDLTCWIHSHPGLGVFFSNSDSTVQMQLRHSQHPNFLIAFVVDILTANQEMGIFTFRNDGTVIAKNDLIKLYSLEELYKWALESGKNDFTPDSYYNILGNAEMTNPACKSISINNNAIIDITQIVIEPVEGLAGWAVGFANNSSGGKEFGISAIVRTSEKPATGIIGCLMSVSHLSVPTIQRIISRENSNINFVMVYSKKTTSLTTIPVVNGEVIADEKYYGDVNLEELKVWTRRKR